MFAESRPYSLRFINILTLIDLPILLFWKMSTQKPVILKTFSCPECEKPRFGSVNALRDHFVAKCHTASNCRKCQKPFKDVLSLIQHYQKHTPSSSGAGKAPTPNKFSHENPSNPRHIMPIVSMEAPSGEIYGFLNEKMLVPRGYPVLRMPQSSVEYGPVSPIGTNPFTIIELHHRILTSNFRRREHRRRSASQEFYQIKPTRTGCHFPILSYTTSFEGASFGRTIRFGPQFFHEKPLRRKKLHSTISISKYV